MKYFKFLNKVPEKTYILIFVAIIILSSFYTYFRIEEAADIEKKIEAKQRDLNRTILLKNMYLSKKRVMEQSVAKPGEEKPLPLSFLEEASAKAFVAGRLAVLKPSAVKEEKVKGQSVFEIKVNGAALGEVIKFVTDVEKERMFVKKLQLNMPAGGQNFVDMFAIITAG
ncbi:MAG: hypothetical protein N2745_12285 [Syntrophorhabdaceae bacterium]|nr:hypothetical protein [Syntrophorhabdaceae bacterium]